MHGEPDALQGTYRDLLRRDPNERKTYVTDKMAKGVQEAVLDYDVLGTRAELSLVRIYLQTGRTHQIRCQFSARGLPLWGDKKYSPMTGRSHSGRTACTLPIRTPARCSISSSSRRTFPPGACLQTKHPAPRRGAFFAQVRDSFPSKCLAIAGCARYNMGISPAL